MDDNQAVRQSNGGSAQGNQAISDASNTQINNGASGPRESMTTSSAPNAQVDNGTSESQGNMATSIIPTTHFDNGASESQESMVNSEVPNTQADNDNRESSLLVVANQDSTILTTMTSDKPGHDHTTTQALVGLMSIPLELRRYIFSFALPSYTGRTLLHGYQVTPEARSVTQGRRAVMNQLPFAQPEKPPRWERWTNCPNKCIALLCVDRQISHEGLEYIYGVAVMEVIIKPTETVFMNTVFPVIDFLPFPSSSAWQYTKNWDVDLQFSAYNPEVRSRWGEHFVQQGQDVRMVQTYARLTPKIEYEFKRIQDGFVALLFELSKLSDLQTLTIRLPCMCPGHGDNSDHGVNQQILREIYYELLTTHLIDACIKPSKSLKIILAPRGQSDTPCEMPQCALFSGMVSCRIMKWPSSARRPCPLRLKADLLGWLELKQRAALLPSTAYVRNMLYTAWVNMEFWSKNTREKKTTVFTARWCIELELAKDEFKDKPEMDVVKEIMKRISEKKGGRKVQPALPSVVAQLLA